MEMKKAQDLAAADLPLHKALRRDRVGLSQGEAALARLNRLAGR